MTNFEPNQVQSRSQIPPPPPEFQPVSPSPSVETDLPPLEEIQKPSNELPEKTPTQTPSETLPATKPSSQPPTKPHTQPPTQPPTQSQAPPPTQPSAESNPKPPTRSQKMTVNVENTSKTLHVNVFPPVSPVPERKNPTSEPSKRTCSVITPHKAAQS